MCWHRGSMWPTTSRPARTLIDPNSSKREQRARGRGALGQQAAGAQPGHDAFAEPVRLFEMRVAREDELGEAELVIFDDAIGDLVVRTDECGADAAAHHADAGPHVRVHHELVAVAAVQ